MLKPLATALMLASLSAHAAVSSPLVIALNPEQQGLEFAFTDSSSAHYDFNNDGIPEPTSWVVGKDNAFLVRDLNGNGRIEGPAEIYGTGPNGFTMLSLNEDTNADGVLDENDLNWAKLRLWLDDNHDGVTDEGELWPLADFEIISIDLAAGEAYVPFGDEAYISAGSRITLANGNQIYIGNLVYNTTAHASN